MAILKVGARAPDLALKDRNGAIHTLSSAGASYKVIYFYPKDDTPGCTLEAQQFSAKLGALKKLGTIVFGISGGDEKSKTGFCKKYGLTVTLLSDPDFSVCKKFGVYGKKTFLGRSYRGIRRQTFILDPRNVVIRVFEQVTPETHAREVVDFLKNMVCSGRDKATVRKKPPRSAKPKGSKGSRISRRPAKTKNRRS